MKYFVSIFVLSILFFSCKKTKDINVVKSSTILINNCETFTLNTTFSICYDSLLFDTRCPDLAMCARRGDVGVKLFFKLGNSMIPFNLADVPTTPGNFPSETIINGVHIKLIDVLPHPFSNQNVEKKVILEIN